MCDKYWDQSRTFCQPDTEVMIKTEVWTGCGMARHVDSVCVCVRFKVEGKCVNTHLMANSQVRAWRHFLSNLHIHMHTHKHTHSADEMFCKGLLNRDGTSLLATTYDPPSLQYTLTHRLLATKSFPPSTFKAWFLFIKSVSSLFLISTFLLCWTLLFVSNPIPPSLTVSLCSSLHLCLLSIISFPAFFPVFFYYYHSLSPFYVLPPPNIPLRSLSVPHSLLTLQISSPLALFFFSSALRPLTPYFPCAFLSPLFSFCSPFLPHSGCQGFVEALSPQLDIQQEKKLKSKLWDQEGRGHGEERTERTGKIKKRGKGGGGKEQMEMDYVKEIHQMPMWPNWLRTVKWTQQVLDGSIWFSLTEHCLFSL